MLTLTDRRPTLRPQFTATEQRIMDLLSDGLRHRKAEIMTCLEDELASPSALFVHIFRIRKKLEGRGEAIICELNGYSSGYRHVRLLRSATDGKS